MLDKMLYGRWSIAAALAVCFIFGVASLALVQGAGDGVWHFYASSFLNGKRLYSDLHLVQQPIFILIHALGMSIFGGTYYGERVIFVFVLGGYLYFAYRLIDRSERSNAFKALLLLVFFFCGINFEAYRFDDYHAFENMLALVVLLLCVDYFAGSVRNPFRVMSILGICIALAVLTRVNDGLVIFAVATGFVIARRQSGFLLHYGSLLVAMLLTAGCVFLILGESPEVWLRSTVLDAVTAKGGASDALLAPLKLIANSADYVFMNVDRTKWEFILGLSVVFSAALVIGKVQSAKIRFALGAMLAIVYYYMVAKCLAGNVIPYFTAMSVQFLVGFVLLRTWPWLRQWGKGGGAIAYSGNQLMILMPLALFVSGSVSSGGWHYGLYFPFALSLVIIAILSDRSSLSRGIGVFLAAVLLQLGVFAFQAKLNNPYSWHSYSSPSLTEKRILVKNDHLGYMLVDRNLEAFIAPVCAIILEKHETSLLSLPFPYANYICGISPWHDHVQSFFDTATSRDIQQIIQELQDGPPRYVLYQRQLENLGVHESLFNGGRPLSHRTLDQFIMTNIDDGKWSIVYKHFVAAFGGSTWMLIDTKPTTH